MSKLTARAASPAGEPLLDARLCAEIGAELVRVREARGLTRSDVGEKLLLSVRQVRALEEVDFAAFHNAVFQLNALKKYAQFADLDPALVSRLSAAIVTPEPESAVRPDAPFAVRGYDEPRRGLRAAVSVLAIAAVVGVGFYLLRARSIGGPAGGLIVAAQVPAAPPRVSGDKELQPSPVTPTVPAPESAERPPEPDPIVVKTPTAFGTLRVMHPSWIFIRDTDGLVVERNLAAGEVFELETQPTYLAVGVSEAELTIGNAAIDVSRFVANGQIRIRAGDFDALVQGASPIQAPTAAAGR
jgi:cytoskeleton protein RodZ